MENGYIGNTSGRTELMELIESAIIDRQYMDDFIQLRRKLYYNIDSSDFQSCTDSSALLFDSLVEREFQGSDFYRACITLKALLDLDPPVPDLQAELSPHLDRVAAYDRFYQEYLLRLDGDSVFEQKVAQRTAAEPGAGDLQPFLHPDDQPIVLFQHLYHGDPAAIGGGNSGGAAAFVRYLGNALARLQEISRVVTLVPAIEGRGNSRLGEGHLLARIPLGFDGTDISAYLRHQDAIELSVATLMHQLPRRPDLVHLRFLDAASLSTARAAKRLSIPVIITLTPDPHRTMCDPSGFIRKVSLSEGLDLLYRIYAGDQIAQLADGIIGIGRQTAKNELIHYFPQLEDITAYQVRSIDEGIPTEPAIESIDAAALFSQENIACHFHKEFADLPVILNVGRLKPVKGQRNLVRAWGESKMWQSYTLALIGGNFENPDADETVFLKFLASYLKDHPHLQGRLAHLPAQANSIIRSIEHSLSSTNRPSLPNLYVCSSAKEEFGISILEAMAAEMVVCAPLRGGAGTYLRHRVNGFLIDTSSYESIASDLTACILEGNLTEPQYDAIMKNAGETVHKNYSIEKISTYYRDFYKEVLNETNRRAP
jgi:glycosyltransferase involved in cell wall biosynthesis